MNQNDVTAVVLLGITMVLWGSTPVIEKIGLRDVEPLTGLFIRSLVVTAILFVVFICTGRIHDLARVSMGDFSLFAASGLMSGLLGTWAYYYVLRTGMASKIVPIAASYPLITALLGMLILREGITLQRVAGIIFTVAGIIFTVAGIILIKWS